MAWDPVPMHQRRAKPPPVAIAIWWLRITLLGSIVWFPFWHRFGAGGYAALVAANLALLVAERVILRAHHPIHSSFEDSFVVRELVDAEGLSFTEVAALIGVSRRTVARLYGSAEPEHDDPRTPS